MDGLLGGVLVGGKSRRMGTDKAGLVFRDRTFVEIAIEALAGLDQTYLLGGPPPTLAELQGLPLVPDVRRVKGPLAGLLAALEHEPEATWVVCACDLPLVDYRVVDWLRSQRSAERRVVLPVVGGRPQPLLAVYEPEARELLQALAEEDLPAPSRLAGRSGVGMVEPPEALRVCFTNVNSPGDFEPFALL